MEPVKQFFTQKFVEAAQHLTPILKASKFKETGVITPDEFVAAGDHLVHHCPTWQWAKGDGSKIKSFLPPDKQFITTKNVPCYKRVSQVDSHTEDQEKIIDDDGDGDGGWVDTHHYSKDVNQVAEVVNELKLTDEDSKGKQHYNKPLIGKTNEDDENEDDDDDEEAEDMDSFITSGKLAQVVNDDDDDNTTVNVSKQQQQSAMASSIAAGGSDPQSSNILQTRTYDLHITYDTYYQTPRMWLYGYDEELLRSNADLLMEGLCFRKNRRPLTVDEMYEDISQDHAHKTVTMETHPHIVTSPMASVHPCRHAEVMKRIIETVAEGGCELGVHLYLMIFLKFVQTVIPTIEYDFTHNFVLEKQTSS